MRTRRPALARLVAYARERDPFINGHDSGPVVQSLPVSPMPRGLGVRLFPDGGEPQPDLDAHRRFLISEVLTDLAGEIHVGNLSTTATSIRLHLGPVFAEGTR